MSKKNNVIEIQPLIEKREEKIRVEAQKKLMDEAIQNAINAPVAPTPSKKELFELSIKALLNTLKCKDDYTYGHSLRVAFLCVSAGKQLGLNEDELYELEISALFHDLGKIGVPDAILKKPSRLTDEEFLEMKLHPTKSAEILEEFPIFEKMAISVRHHHERFDGRGYPAGLKAEEIPLFSRIILIADTFDAMTSTRPYRKGLPFDVAFSELREFSGSQFDPFLVEQFIASMEIEREKNQETFNLQVIAGEFKKDAA